MTPEEEMILFAILQDIADELRRIAREEREAEKPKSQECSIKQPQNDTRPFEVEISRKENEP